MLHVNLQRTVLALALLITACTGVLRAQDGNRQQTPNASSGSGIPASEQGVQSAPQVLTVVHRLNGLKVLRVMRRSGAQVAELDKDFIRAPVSHTTITAGLALGDGHLVVARLEQAEVEVDADAAPAVSMERVSEADSTNLLVVGRNGQQFAARYVGLDGSTGLSFLQVDGLTLPLMRDAAEERLQVGQRVRLCAPEPASRAEGTATAGTLYLRVGEVEGEIALIARTPSGKIARINVRASHLSRAIVGGLALDEAGDIIGIVESNRGKEARIIPLAAVRLAAERVMARRGSVPRPWLGARGRELSASTIAQLTSVGWKRAKAAQLVSKGQGILLTSVDPATPAAVAGLRAGDIIERVDGRELKGAQDFSLMLDEAGGRATIRLMVLRPNRAAPLAFTVKLEETLTPAARTQMAEASAGHAQVADPFISRGAETIMLSQKAAANLGAQGGRLVVFVQPQSAASRAGLRAGDVIESLDGRALSETGLRPTIILNSPAQRTLGIVRDGQRLKISLP
ncbi:MAG TPA: PDZ domain-containing protein [Pyrinomonadaceae bacterium]